MIWYLIPIFAKTVDGNTYNVPGMGDPVSGEAPVGNFTLHAADPKAAPTTALIGVASAPSPVPTGWIPKTVPAAQAHFQAVTGRAPLALEVF